MLAWRVVKFITPRWPKWMGAAFFVWSYFLCHLVDIYTAGFAALVVWGFCETLSPGISEEEYRRRMRRP